MGFPGVLRVLAIEKGDDHETSMHDLPGGVLPGGLRHKERTARRNSSPRRSPGGCPDRSPDHALTEAPPTASALPTGGRIEGQVFKDPGHKLLAGVTVTLADPEKREAVAVAKSDGSGNYLFEGVKPGKYALSVTWEFTDKTECAGGNMFGPSITLFQKEDGTYVALTSALVQFEMKAAEDAKIDLRVLCSE